MSLMAVHRRRLPGERKSVNDIALKHAAAYAVRHHLRLTERLGFGIHGTVLVAEREGNQATDSRIKP